MKSIFTASKVACAVLITIVFQPACKDTCQTTTTYRYYDPVYTSFATIKSETGMRAAKDIVTVGKIYVKGDLLFVNEPQEGIHIFNNHDPAQPQAIGFLNIPGNYDLAVEDNALFADSYNDLVVFDISTISHVNEVSRLSNYFSSYNNLGFASDPVKGVVTSWKPNESVNIQKGDCDVNYETWGGIFYDGGIAFTTNSGIVPGTASAPVGTSGTGGSTARFALLNHYLYSLDGSNLNVADIHVSTAPVIKPPVYTSWAAETVFPYKDNIFIGSRIGMAVFDVSVPDQPTSVSTFDHIESCDPVVVEGDYAYVTLYSGGVCHIITNELQIVTLADLKSPSLVKNYPMTSPHGLGIDNGTLFICDGTDGLKVYDASDPLALKLLAHYGEITSQDIIPQNGKAIMTGADGIYQYDYSDLNNIRRLSKISVSNSL